MVEYNAQPKPWRCLHCNERVDPTMELCWSCGHDREGVAQPALFVDVPEAGVVICTRCAYDLQGNPEAERCPECGEPVPWEDCAACGTRGSRLTMTHGCLVCEAEAAGHVFVPVVERKVRTHCPRCAYDMHGLPENNACPECGLEAPQVVYDTVVEPRISRSINYKPLLRFLVSVLVVPVGLAALVIAAGWISAGMMWAGFMLLGLWVVSVLGSIMLLNRLPDPPNKPLHVDKRPL
ncbi:MAG: hypothetical protein ACIAXF_17035 [Phycisphaerales bacterium JB063]